MRRQNIFSRRDFIISSGIAASGLVITPGINSFNILTGKQKKIGYALVGLGYYSRDLLGPAFSDCKTAYLAGIVTGTPSKEIIWAEKYNLSKKNIYNYDNFDNIASNPDIDIIYIVLPNNLHKEFTFRSARAGKHILCEKPMALDAQECRDMISACEDAKVKLSVGYRIHYEKNTQEIIRLGREKVYGEVRFVHAGAGFLFTSFSNWRTRADMGGGALMDMGVYAIQGARYATGEEPDSVSAQTFTSRPEYFKEVDEITTMQMHFPSGTVANLETTFHANCNYLRITAEKGWYGLSPFQSYGGIKGTSKNGPIELPNINQQAVHMDDFAISVRDDKPVFVTGNEGLMDMRIVDNIRKSLKSGGKAQQVQ